MKIISELTPKKGKRRVVVELDKGELLLPVTEAQYYRIGCPLEDVVQGHTLAAAEPVSWCAVEQKWVS